MVLVVLRVVDICRLLYVYVVSVAFNSLLLLLLLLLLLSLCRCLIVSVVTVTFVVVIVIFIVTSTPVVALVVIVVYCCRCCLCCHCCLCCCFRCYLFFCYCLWLFVDALLLLVLVLVLVLVLLFFAVICYCRWFVLIVLVLTVKLVKPPSILTRNKPWIRCQCLNSIIALNMNGTRRLGVSFGWQQNEVTKRKICKPIFLQIILPCVSSFGRLNLTGRKVFRGMYAVCWEITHYTVGILCCVTMMDSCCWVIFFRI
jgi:hypothetical protein